MAVWDALMPTDFTDGQTVDEGDLDPVVKNLATVRYATVFESGIRRMNTINSPNATEINFMQVPSFTMEAGYLYKIEGLVSYRPGAADNYPQVNVRQGAGLAGTAILQMIMPPTGGPTGINIPFVFSTYVKAVATASQIYTVGVFKAGGISSIDFQLNSWVAVLRSGLSSLLVDGS